MKTISEHKEKKQSKPGWKGLSTLSIVEHQTEPGVLCVQVADEIKWQGGKSYRTDVVWLTRDQVLLLYGDLKDYLMSTANVLWTDGYGITRRADEMTTHHLKNVVSYLAEQGQYDHPFIPVANYELQRRGE